MDVCTSALTSVSPTQPSEALASNGPNHPRHRILPRVLQRTRTLRTSGARRNTFYVGVSLARFRVWWLVFLSVHVVCIGYFSFCAYAYWMLRDSYTGLTLQSYQAVIHMRHFPVIAVCHAAIAAGHTFYFLRMFLSSLLLRRFTFGKPSFRMPKPKAATTVSAASDPKSYSTQRSKVPARVANAVRWLDALWVKAFSRRGVFGIESRHFEVLFTLREVFEGCLQAGQAYRMSLYVPRVLLNRFYVAVIVVNCVSSPLAHHVYVGDPPRVRLVCLVLDILLDFASSVAIPIALLVPYRDTFTIADEAFDFMLWYNDRWLVNTINEFKLLFVNSWPDLVARLFFSASLLVGLQSIKSLLRKTVPRIHPGDAPTRSTASFLQDAPEASERRASRWFSFAPAMRQLVSSVSRRQSAGTSTRSRTTGSGAMAASASSKSTVSVTAAPVLSQRIARMAHALFPVWGIIVLVLHVRGEFRAVPPECTLSVRPWFSTKAACALVQINCARQANHTGAQHEMDALFERLDDRALAHIVIRHCPRVEISPQLQRFSSLIGLKIYNSTLVRWGHDAALTQMHHPHMVFVFIVRVNMSAFPDGLLSDAFPRQLLDVEFAGTNLTEIPDAVGTTWPVNDNSCGVFEQGALQTVPRMLATLQSAFLSLVRNNISDVPSFLFTNAHAATLWLSDNPITRLPEPLVPSRSIRAVRLARTRLAALPAWMDARFFEHARLVAGGTPLCQALLAAVSSMSTSSGGTDGTAAASGGVDSTQSDGVGSSDKGDSGGGDGRLTSADSSTAATSVSAFALAAFASGRVECDEVDGDLLTYYPTVAEASFD